MDKKIIKVRLPLQLWEEFYAMYPDKYERSLVVQRLITILLEVSQCHLTLLEQVKRRLEQEKEEMDGFFN